MRGTEDAAHIAVQGYSFIASFRGGERERWHTETGGSTLAASTGIEATARTSVNGQGSSYLFLSPMRVVACRTFCHERDAASFLRSWQQQRMRDMNDLTSPLSPLLSALVGVDGTKAVAKSKLDAAA